MGAISFFRDLPNPGIELMAPATPASQADFLLLSHRGGPCVRLDNPEFTFLLKVYPIMFIGYRHSCKQSSLYNHMYVYELSVDVINAIM